MFPKYIFIVPYRKREQHKNFFLRYMKYILEDLNEEDYEIIFSNQTDDRPFNRGAVKNIGFKYAKNKYINDYKNINFVFHDIDVMPCKKGLLNYDTEKGTIKHFYGFYYALGGIFSIKGEDFENINGFPNYWSWSLEDNCIQKRAEKNNLIIDRSIFFKIGDFNILHIHDGIYKDYSNTNYTLFTTDTGNEGIRTILKLKTEDEEKPNNDGCVKHTMCNIISFNTLYHYASQEVVEKHDLRGGNNLTSKKSKRMNNVFNQLVYR